MAKKSSSAESITLTQQAVNVLRQQINSIGWAKTIEDISIGGELLSKVIPKLEPTDWVKTPEEIQKLKPEELRVYVAKDQAWGAKPLTFVLTVEQRAVAVKAFRYWVEEAGKAGKLGPSEWLTELIGVLGLSTTEKD